MSTTGVIFDIKEFAVHDGPGIRLTVFMKGCALRCMWCHNPESLSLKPQTMASPAGDRISGAQRTSEDIAGVINTQAEILRLNNGGVTFSGGEPLMQAPFVSEVIDRLDNVHVLLDTSGYAHEDALRSVVARSDLVYFDIKLVDPDAHRKYTGVDNAPILRNLTIASNMDVDLVIRIPLVPGVTDTDGNLAAIAEIAHALPSLSGIELLPYNRAAGGKYAACGMEFTPEYDEERAVNANSTPFEDCGLPVRIR